MPTALQNIAATVSPTGSANPIANPGAFDVFKLGGVFSPFSKISSCNGRKRIFQEQQAPGFLGAFLVDRGEKLVEVTYDVIIISPAMFTAVRPLLALCAAANKARPIQGLKLIDLRLADLRIPQIAVEVMPWQEQLEPGKWGYKFQFHEYKRLQVAGGPVQAPRNAFEEKIAVARQELKGATANAYAAKAAARAASNERTKRNPHVPGP